MTNFAELSHLIVREIAQVWVQDGGNGESHFNFMSMVVGSQQPLEERHYFYIVQEWKSQEISETLTDLGVPEGEDNNVYKAALRTLDAYFTPQVNVLYKQHIFRQMKQEEHETVNQFVVRLSNQVANCEFGATKNEQICDQILDKCKSTELRRKLLGKGHELTLAEMQKIAQSLELSQT